MIYSTVFIRMAAAPAMGPQPRARDGWGIKGTVNRELGLLVLWSNSRLQTTTTTQIFLSITISRPVICKPPEIRDNVKGRVLQYTHMDGILYSFYRGIVLMRTFAPDSRALKVQKDNTICTCTQLFHLKIGPVHIQTLLCKIGFEV